jgi:hypothetical protein
MMELIHITAVYTNAMLVAILPQVSDFAKKLNLPVPQPITASQVVEFKPSPYKGEIGGGLMLSNHYWFSYADGHVLSFRSPDNFFSEDDPVANWQHYVGKENMTTNQAIELARKTLRDLGYKPEELHADVPPTNVQLPFDYQGKHIPQFQMRWESSETNSAGHETSVSLHFDVNLDKKSFTGMALIGQKLRRPPPKVDVEPELESHFRERTKAKLFIRTNAPARLTNGGN